MVEFTSTVPDWVPQFNIYKKLKKILNPSQLMPSAINHFYGGRIHDKTIIFNGNGKVMYTLEEPPKYQKSARCYYELSKNGKDIVYISLARIDEDRQIPIEKEKVALSKDQISHLRNEHSLIDKMDLDSRQIRHLKILSMSFPEILLKYGLSRIQ